MSFPLEKENRRDQERWIRAKSLTLPEAERENCQEMYAAEAITLEALRSRLDILGEARERGKE